MEELLQEFLAETSDNLEQVGAQIVRFESDPSDLESIGGIFRLVHTIKGTCGFLDLPRLEKIAHAAESLIGTVRDRAQASSCDVELILLAIDQIRQILAVIETQGAEPEGEDRALITALLAAAGEDAGKGKNESASPALQSGAFAAGAAHAIAGAPQNAKAHGDVTNSAAAQDAGAMDDASRGAKTLHKESATIRVAVNTLERIMRLVSELVLTRNQLLELARNDARGNLSAPLQRLSGITSDLQRGIMHARMQPVERLFSSLPRMIRDLAANLAKKVELQIDGADTELDRQLIELIRDPITHLVRNCLDHGIETPEERMRMGKPEAGLLRVHAAHEAGHVLIRIEDDGRGIDLARVKEKALKQGLADAQTLAEMGDDEVCRFIFAPGFSTSEQVTHISGRGIGMDVVRENIESISGSIALSTSRGRGTAFTLKIPLTLAIAPALIFEASGQRFAVPQHMVVEAVSLRASQDISVKHVQGNLLLELRGELLALQCLSRLLNIGQMKAVDQGYAIVMRSGSRTFALAVDDVSDVQEIVLQPMSSRLAQLKAYSGNTILGDGSVVLILNPHGLADIMGLEAPQQYQVETQASDIAPRATATQLILFKAGAGPRKAVPLSLISRIETVDAVDISLTDGKHVARRNGSLMPLIALCELVPGRKAWPALIVNVGGEPLGILVEEIVDIVAVHLDINIAGASEELLGAANILGEATEVLDLAHFMKTGRPDAFDRRHARKFRVLLVDDKIFFRDLLAPVMSACGYEVHSVASAAEAFAFLARGIRVDAIVSDIDMPEMDGYMFARKLRANARTASIPIVALDAYAGANVVQAAKAAGMTAVAGKFDRKALLDGLGKALDGVAFQTNSLENSNMEAAA